MERILKGFVIINLLLVCWCMVLMYEVQYNIGGRVVEKEENIITLEDVRGQLWEIEDDGRDLYVGEPVSIQFHKNFTESIIEDDIVVKVKGL